MERYVKATINCYKADVLARVFFKRAQSVSGAEYYIEDIDSDITGDSYFLYLIGSRKEIYGFMGYLRSKGVKVKKF